MTRLPLSLLFLVFQLACAPATQPAGAILYEHKVRQDPPQHLHIATVDLTDPRVSVAVCPAGPKPDDDGPWQTSLTTVRTIARRDGLAVAVNGDFFSTKETREIMGRKVAYFENNPARVVGWAMSDGALWSRPAGNVGNALVVTNQGRIIITKDVAPHLKTARQIIGGSSLIVENGKVVRQAPPKPGGEKSFIAPRTAAGTNRQGTRLILLVVDGRRKDYAAGMSLEQLGQEMLHLGCETAINLDGGGSTTMVLRDGEDYSVVNRPSDGNDLLIPLNLERPVANALGVKVRK